MLNDKLKIDSLKTAMKNPRIAKLIMEAAKSPVGSSARERARSVVGSLVTAKTNKIQKSMIPVMHVPTSGKGGQGGPKSKEATITLMPPPAPIAPLRISLRPVRPYSFKAPEVPIQNAPSPMSLNPPMAHDGQGGLPSNTTYQEPKSRLGGLLGSIKSGFSDTFKGLGSSALNAVKDIGAGVKSFVSGAASIPLAGAEGLIRYTTDPTKPSLTQAIGESKGQEMFNQVIGSPSSQIPKVPNVINAAQPSPQTGEIHGPFKPSTEIAQGPTGQTQVPYGPGLDSSGQPVNIPQTGTSTGASSSGDPLADYLMQAYSAGIGRNAFALGAMADSKKLQALFPNVPADQIPVGASLAGQLNALEENLKKEYRISELGDALTRAVTRGVTLTDDVTAYIRGKDEFLNSVDKMLTNATEQYWNSSMRSDPFYSKSMEQYTNYLTILKGRTTQRYIDYLNTSINYHNGQVQQLQTAYDKAAELVNSTYQQKAAITAEEYNNLKETLMEMYDNVAARARLMSGTTAESLEYYKNQASLAESVLKNAAMITDPSQRAAYLEQYGALAGLSGIDSASVSKSTDLSAADIATVATEVGTAISLEDALSNPVLQSKGISPAIIAKKYAEVKATQDAQSVASDAASINSKYDEFRNESSQLGALIQSIADNGGDTTELQSLKDSYDRTRDTGFLNGIKTLVTGKIDTVRDILNDMKGYDSYEKWLSGGFWGKNRTSKYSLDGENSDIKAIIQYLWEAAKANGKETNWSSETADAIAQVIFAQF